MKRDKAIPCFAGITLVCAIGNQIAPIPNIFILIMWFSGLYLLLTVNP